MKTKLKKALSKIPTPALETLVTQLSNKNFDNFKFKEGELVTLFYKSFGENMSIYDFTNAICYEYVGE